MKIGDRVIVANTIVPYCGEIEEIFYDNSQIIPTPMAVRVKDQYTSYIVDMEDIILDPMGD